MGSLEAIALLVLFSPLLAVYMSFIPGIKYMGAIWIKVATNTNVNIRLVCGGVATDLQTARIGGNLCLQHHLAK